MKASYLLTRETTVALGEEFLQMSPVRSGARRSLGLVSLLIAAMYSYHRPASLVIGDLSPMLTSFLLTILVQIPLSAFLLFRFLPWLGSVVDLPRRVLRATIAKQPDETFGAYHLDITEEKITIGNDMMSRSARADLIEAVCVTQSGFHLLRGSKPLFQIPKEACSIEELTDALGEHIEVQISDTCG